MTVAVIEIDWRPDDRRLRQFAIVLLLSLGLAGAFAAWKLSAVRHAAPIALWALGIALAAIGLAAPRWIWPLYIVWMAVALPLGWVMSHMALGIIYFLVFTPIALIFRLIGRDFLHRRFDRRAESYWIKRGLPGKVAHYFRQF
jgi:membrane protease YdiL (CAAX protease family)